MTTLAHLHQKIIWHYVMNMPTRTSTLLWLFRTLILPSWSCVELSARQSMRGCRILPALVGLPLISLPGRLTVAYIGHKSLHARREGVNESLILLDSNVHLPLFLNARRSGGVRYTESPRGHIEPLKTPALC